MTTPDSTAPPSDGARRRRLGIAEEARTADGEPTVHLGEPAPGARFVLGRYELQERLGAGGFGVVWRAFDKKLERDVAVKVVPREDSPGDRSRVTREALAAARLNHPGIVALYELGSDDHDVYLVSELVHGATVEELAREGALSDRDVARIGHALCEALEHAHARGVIHRDVKPGNVMVLAEPAAGAGFAKLTDFGIAHLATGEGLTATGDVMGTLAYMAPEQAEGRRVTEACDVYSLALTLYEAWTGSNPVRGQSPAATVRNVGRPLPPLHSRRSDLPPALGAVLDAALDPDPLYRPAPAELRVVLGDVEDALSDEGGLVEPETIERFGLTAVRVRTRMRTLLHRGAARAPAAAPDAHELSEAQPRGLAALVAPRLAAGAGAGMLVLAALEGLGPTPPTSPAAAAGVTALLVALLPRIGWLAAAVASAPGWRRPRPTAPAPRSCWLPLSPPCRCFSRGRGCCGRCPAWRLSWAPWLSRRCSWASPRWPRPASGAWGSARPASSGWRLRRWPQAAICCSVWPTGPWSAERGRPPWWTPWATLSCPS